MAAAEADPGKRRDWERRLISSARWLMSASQTRWYAESLVHSVIALECLLLNQKGGPKKVPLAKRATMIHVMPGTTASKQREWLEEIYDSRNFAAHEGLDFERDLQG